MIGCAGLGAGSARGAERPSVGARCGELPGGSTIMRTAAPCRWVQPSPACVQLWAARARPMRMRAIVRCVLGGS